MPSKSAASKQVSTLVLLERLAAAAIVATIWASVSALIRAATLEKVVLKTVLDVFREDFSASTKGVYSVYTADTKSRKGIRIKRNPDGLGCY